MNFLELQFLADDLVDCFKTINVYQRLITSNVLFDNWIGGWDMRKKIVTCRLYRFFFTKKLLRMTVGVTPAENKYCTVKKNTLTGLVNCKKTTRHHAHLSLCAKSRETKDVKSRKWPKISIGAIFLTFRGQISRNCKFF